MGTLHTVNRSPFADQSLQSCLSLCAPEDAVLLIEDGVYSILATSPAHAALEACLGAGTRVYALSEDARARGLEGRGARGVEMTDYAGFVALAVEHHRVQSWY